jgi:hypothetical protein
MAGLSETTEAKDLLSNKGDGEEEPDVDDELDGEGTTAGDEALAAEPDRTERQNDAWAAGDVEDGELVSVVVEKTLDDPGRAHNDLKCLTRWPNPYRCTGSPACTRLT